MEPRWEFEITNLYSNASFHKEDEMRQQLDIVAREGYEFVAVAGEYLLFKRPFPPEDPK